MQSLHLVRKNSMHWQRLRDHWLESSFAEAAQGVLVNTKLTMRHQCATPTENSNSVQDHIRGSISSKSGDVIPSLHSAQMRPYLEFWVQCWALQYKSDMDMLEWVQ